jgi:hypothetical protein
MFNYLNKVLEEKIKPIKAISAAETSKQVKITAP